MTALRCVALIYFVSAVAIVCAFDPSAKGWDIAGAIVILIFAIIIWGINTLTSLIKNVLIYRIAQVLLSLLAITPFTIWWWNYFSRI